MKTVLGKVSVVVILILLLATPLSLTDLQNSIHQFRSQGIRSMQESSSNHNINKSAGYVKCTLDLVNKSLINGNFINPVDCFSLKSVVFGPQTGFVYIANWEATAYL